MSIKRVNPWHEQKEINSEAETPVLWPTDVKSNIGKDPDAGKDWGQEKKRAAEDEMVGWHHRLKGLKSEQMLGDSEGQKSLACCSPWGGKEWDSTQRLNNSSNEWAKHARGQVCTGAPEGLGQGSGWQAAAPGLAELDIRLSIHTIPSLVYVDLKEYGYWSCAIPVFPLVTIPIF